MYFTLAISAATRQTCAGLIAAALGTDPRVLPIPGPAAVAWRAPDERAAVLRWGRPVGHDLADQGPAAWSTAGPAGSAGAADGHHAAASHEGTIWADAEAVHARTGLARVDPVYLTQIPGAVLVCDRASWSAAVAGAFGHHDPVMVGAFLSMGYPIGAATPFRGVRALGRDRSLTVTGGRPVVTSTRDRDADRGEGGGGSGRRGSVRAGRRGPGRCGRAAPRRRGPRRAVPDRGEGQPADRRRADGGQGAVPGPHARVRPPSRTSSSRP